MPPTIRQLKTDNRTPQEKQLAFLEAFVELVSVTRAAKKARIYRTIVYDWIRDDPDFKKAYESACEIATFKLEDEAVRRAYEGTLQPVYQGGVKVGSIRKYSDLLLILLLKARAPEKYKDRVASEHTGKNGGPIEVNGTITHNINFKRSDGSSGG
jgi:hypothetical protein